MKRVKVKFFADLRSLAKREFLELEIEGAITLRELLKRVSSEIGINLEEKLLENNRIKSGFMILINGRNAVYLDGVSTLIEEGEIALFPPAGGG